MAAQASPGLERRTAEVRETPARRGHRTRHSRAQARAQVTCGVQGCTDNATAAQATAANVDTQGNATPGRTRTVDANGNGVILGSRPSGCPHRFCGCEASLYVFGSIKPELNLAANWVRKFPRTSPGPGMVAARSGHVFVLINQVSGNEWLVHDGNSGGGKTRQHVRSIAGYAIVNPHASNYAAN
jgi:hypothetical protein